MIQARSLTRILDAAFGIVRAQAGLLIGLGLVYDGLANAAMELLISEEYPFFSFESMLLMFVPSVFGMLSAYATTWTLMRIARGERPTLAAALASPWRAGFGLIVVAVLYTALMTVGVMLLLLPGLVLWALIFCLPAVLAAEPIAPLAAPGRAWRLGRGHRLRAFGLVIGLFALSIPILAVPAYITELAPAWSSLAAVPLLLLYGAFAALANATTFFFYVDLRVRKESFDLELLADQVESSADREEGLG
ncbi:MAG: hypothetical protein MJE66_03685 [Proteobacteria bacterium]|nr:hypothetical protein [Pseudomonadota bacterium]